jgi:hydroxyacyl-ACP dehydratase HTD2-like protein with hotdog domain
MVARESIVHRCNAICVHTFAHLRQSQHHAIFAQHASSLAFSSSNWNARDTALPQTVAKQL